MFSNLSGLENRLDSFFNNTALSLFLICCTALLVRILLFPVNLPVTLDGITYFWYAHDISILRHLPTEGYQFANNGWPMFLSLFFSSDNSNNFMNLMNLQRAVTATLSVVSIVPVYFLCRKFFDKPYALFGASLFAFEPRIILSSLSGLTESFYIVLISTALVLFFNTKKSLVYLSFGIVGAASLVRSEGMFVFIPLMIIFIIKNRREDKVIIHSIVSALIYVSVIVPIALWRLKILGTDELGGRVIDATQQGLAASKEVGLISFIEQGVWNVIKLTGWSFVPLLIIFVPLGIFLILKKRDGRLASIAIILGFMFIPVAYAFSFNPETRYIYPLYPLLCILAIFTVKEFRDRIHSKNLTLILIILIIIALSIAFLFVKEMNFGHQKEAYGIATHLIGTVNGVNEYYPESSYLQPAEISSKWPTTKSSFIFSTKIIPIGNYSSITKFIIDSEKKGLTHLVIDTEKNRPAFLMDIFYHEENYPFLTKTWDSSEFGYKYHVKVYKIDYDKFHAYNSRT